MKQIRWRALLAAMLAASMAALVAISVSSPAVAEPGLDSPVRLEMPKGAVLMSYLAVDESGKPLDVSVSIEAAGTKQYAVFRPPGQSASLVCTGYASPAPVYSWSNHTLHYGSKATCNQPTSVKTRMSLWSGPTYEATTQWQDDTPWSFGTGTAYDDVQANCVDWGYSIYWKLLGYDQAWWDGAWLPFSPYPGVDIQYEGCADIA